MFTSRYELRTGLPALRDSQEYPKAYGQAIAALHNATLSEDTIVIMIPQSPSVLIAAEEQSGPRLQYSAVAEGIEHMAQEHRSHLASLCQGWEIGTSKGLDCQLFCKVL